MIGSRGEDKMHKQIGRNRQAGMTGIGWLIVLFLIGFFAMLTFRLAPVYMENYSVKQILASLEQDPLIAKKSKREIQTLIRRKLKVNSVYDLDPKVFKITKRPGKITITADYEIRKPTIGNVELVVSFHEKAELTSR
jgi:cell division protein FtsL